MRTPPLLLFLTMLAVATGSVTAQETAAARGGTTVSLSTSGRVFAQPTVPSPTAALPPLWNNPLKFTATIVLFNRSTRGIDFDFPSADAAKRHFAFQILDTDGKVIWQSSLPAPAGVTDPAVFHDTLNRFSAWHLTLPIPLVVDGKPLPVGKYILEAGIDGTPIYNAQSTFEVGTAPVVESGVRGVVLAGPITPVNIAGVVNESPVPKAIVTYYNALMANAVVTTIIADDMGRFHFSVPPGLYIVTATIPGDENMGFGHGTQQVTVTAGHVTDVVFHLDTGMR